MKTIFYKCEFCLGWDGNLSQDAESVVTVLCTKKTIFLVNKFKAKSLWSVLRFTNFLLCFNEVLRLILHAIASNLEILFGI